MYVLKFESSQFTLLQTISGTKNMIKPSISEDHLHLIFGDETAGGANLATIYAFNEQTGLF